MFTNLVFRMRSSLPTVCLLIVTAVIVPAVQAADASFVGLLALAVEKGVAAQLELSEETRAKLLQLIDQRESQALEIVQENRDLPPPEQAARLLPFVAESERLGFQLLTLAQREKLQQIRIARSGMLTLGEDGLAGPLGLNAQQRTQVRELLQQRATDLTRGGESEQRITRGLYERKLASLLSEPQRAAWEKMAGLSDSRDVAPAPATPAQENRQDPTPLKTGPAGAASPQAAAENDPPAVPMAASPAATAEAPAAPAGSAAGDEPEASTSETASAAQPAAASPAAVDSAAVAPAAPTEAAAAAPQVPASAAPVPTAPAVTAPVATAPAAAATDQPAAPEAAVSGAPLEAATEPSAAAVPAPAMPVPAAAAPVETAPSQAAADAAAATVPEAAAPEATGPAATVPAAAAPIETAPAQAATEPAAATAPAAPAAAVPAAPTASEPAATDASPEPSVAEVPSTVIPGGQDAMAPTATSPASPGEAQAAPEADVAAEATPADPNSAFSPGTEPAAPAAAATPSGDEGAAAEGEAEGTLQFNFSSAPWKDVLEWFAEGAGLSLAVEAMPVGSFSYRDDRAYAVDEALDLLNSYLLTRGYTLVRRERMLMVIDLESPIPEELVTLVTIEELEERGRYELVKCLFPLARMKPEEAKAMVEEYLGPQGNVIAFPAARQILVTETAGKLRTIRDMIERVEAPGSGALDQVVDFPLENVSAEEVLAIARPLLGLSPDQNFNADISLSFDPLGTRLFATGKTEKLQLLKDLLPKIDRPASTENGEAQAVEELTLKTYYIKAADPQLVLRITQTLLANLPGIRMEVDATSGKLVALARGAEHSMIEETIRQLEGQTQQFEVIQLKRTDPQLAVMAINKFFGLTTDSKAGPNPDNPIVDGDPLTMKLWVRGTEMQLEQIRDLVEKLEGPEEEGASRTTVRMLPLNAAAAESALETVQQFWKRENKIRMVTPSALTPSNIRLRTITPADEEPFDSPAAAPPEGGGLPAPPSARPSAGEPAPAAAPQSDRSAGWPAAAPVFRLTSQLQPPESTAGESDPASPASPGDAETERPADLPAEGDTDGDEPEPSDIRVAITPGGIMIASDDPDALDEFEELLRSVSGPAGLAPQREITVFYLKYAKADVAYALLQEVMSGAGAESAGGTLLGDVASNLLGGGLLGGLVSGMSGGSSGTTTATTLQATGLVTLVPDPRLNALIVEANEADLQFIEQLLQVIDRESSITDIETAGMPRLIPVVYSSADEMANVVRQAFPDRIATSGGQQQRGPSPEDLIRALRGQRGGGDDRESRGEQQKMTIGVDARSNSLIVTAPEPLFRQVELLVQQIDQPGSMDSDIVSVVPVKKADPEVLQKTLKTLMTGSTTGSSSGRSSAGASQPSSGGPSPDEIRQRIEFFRNLQGGGGGPPGGFGGRSFGGRDSGGRGGRGR